MKFVTFNIRLDWGRDGANNFAFRKPLILETLAAEKPDIICFQEVLPHVLAWLKESLPEYTVLGCGRGPALDDECVAIAFRTMDWNLVQLDTFWLSPTPRVPGSRYPDQSDCPRVAAEALLNRAGSGRVVRVVNTHLDHEGRQARALGLAQILRHIDGAELFPDAPVIFAGDFNAAPDSPELRAFERFPGYVNATEGIGRTYHGFMRGPGSSIDYIFLRGGVDCQGVTKWRHARDGVWLSDHYPVCATLEWR